MSISATARLLFVDIYLKCSLSTKLDTWFVGTVPPGFEIC